MNLGPDWLMCNQRLTGVLLAFPLAHSLLFTKFVFIAALLVLPVLNQKNQLNTNKTSIFLNNVVTSCSLFQSFVLLNVISGVCIHRGLSGPILRYSFSIELS